MGRPPPSMGSEAPPSGRPMVMSRADTPGERCRCRDRCRCRRSGADACGRCRCRCLCRCRCRCRCRFWYRWPWPLCLPIRCADRDRRLFWHTRQGFLVPVGSEDLSTRSASPSPVCETATRPGCRVGRRAERILEWMASGGVALFAFAIAVACNGSSAGPDAGCEGLPPGLGLLCADRPATCSACTCLPCADSSCDKWCENPCWLCVQGRWVHGAPACRIQCADAGP